MTQQSYNVTDFTISWNNIAINTACPICGERTEPSINFQVQTKHGEALCEGCLVEHATDLAEVLYAYFAYQYPNDEMIQLFLSTIKEKQLSLVTKPKVVPHYLLEELQETCHAIMLYADRTPNTHNLLKQSEVVAFLVTKKWLALHDPAFATYINENKHQSHLPYDELSHKKGTPFYEIALKEGDIMAESHLWEKENRISTN